MLINTIALSLFGYDKQCAKKHQWRISEKALLTSAIIGGSLGAGIGMILFRHKTKHKTFQLGIPLILTAQILILLIIY